MNLLKKIFLLVFGLLCYCNSITAQKLVHIPDLIADNSSITYNQYETDNFVIFYGDVMPSTYDPAETLAPMEIAYSYYADSINYQTTLANEFPYKFIVIVDESWSTTPSPNTATPNSVRNFNSVVDGIWLDLNTAINTNEFLKAHEVVHLFQRLKPIIYPPDNEIFAYQSLEETHAQYLAYNTYKTQNPDYLGRQDRNRISWLRQNVYLRYFLLFYLQEKITAIGVNGLYSNLYFLEHPFKGYGRIFNRSVEYVNSAFAEYAMRAVNFDFIQRENWEAPLNLYERNGILEAQYNASTEWYNVPATSSSNSIAPEAYGFNVHEIKTYNTSQIDLTFESTKTGDTLAGNKFGFVAIHEGQARYSAVYTEMDTNVSFDVNPEEKVFLVVTGAPKDYVYINTSDIDNEIYDYPYRYKVDIEINCPEFLDDCDDGDLCTTDDVYDANCNCIGTFEDNNSFEIPYVSYNVNSSGWESFNGDTITVNEGDNIFLSWTGISPNETWYAPDGSILGTNISLFLSNIEIEESGVYNLTVFDAINCNSDMVAIPIEVLCPNLGQPCDDGTSLTTNDTYNEECLCVGESGFTISITAVLEGFLQSNGNMTTTLNASNLLPTQQPFNTSPWNYDGDEFFAQLPINAIDWVLLNLYDSNNQLLESKAGMIFSNGEIYNLFDGNNYIQFSSSEASAAYISVHHKSHLAIVSSLSNVQNNHLDLTNEANILGINQTKNLNNLANMICGDYDANGLINNLDYNIWSANSSAINDYFTHDGDGNAIINNNDFNLWAINKSKVGELLIQY